MMNRTKKADLGDVIRSEKFAFGRYDYQKDSTGYLIPKTDVITVDGKTREYSLKFRKPGTPFDQDLEDEIVELGAYEESRGLALFVVEHANMQGGGTGHGPGDVYPDGWHVQARRLDEDGSYNPDGELIQFYQSGPSTHVISEVELMSRMKRIFVKEE